MIFPSDNEKAADFQNQRLGTSAHLFLHTLWSCTQLKKADSDEREVVGEILLLYRWELRASKRVYRLKWSYSFNNLVGHGEHSMQSV